MFREFEDRDRKAQLKRNQSGDGNRKLKQEEQENQRNMRVLLSGGMDIEI
jgi:hypothetical protein